MADQAKRLRVLFASHGGGGGAQESLHSLISAMKALPVEPVLLERREDADTECARGEGVEVCVSPWRWWTHLGAADPDDRVRFSAEAAGRVLAVREVVEQAAPDVVLVNSSVSLVPALAAVMARRPVVWSVREVLRPGTELWGGMDTRFVAATISLLSAQVVCVSQASAAAFAGLAPASSLSVIHTGFPASQPYAAEELPAEVREGGPGVKRVVFVGDFIECKGLPVLANAMAQVFRQSSDCRLYMAGQERRWTLADFLGWLPPEARGRVRHLGFRRDITRILPAMDVMVQPSREDAFPRVVCEAMAAGLPVVGTRSGGMEEQVVDGETGYLAPVGDANAVAQAVLRLLADPDRCRAMGQAGRRRFETHFRLETMSERFLGVLRQARGAALSPAAQSFVEGFVGQWAAQGELLRRLAEEGDGRHRGLGRVGSWLRRLAGRATRKGI